MAKSFGFTYDEKKKMADQTAQILIEEIGLKGDAVEAVYLIPEIEEGHLTMELIMGSVLVIIFSTSELLQTNDHENPVIKDFYRTVTSHNTRF